MIHVKAVEICPANNNRQKTKSGDEDRKLKGNCIRLLLTVRKSYAHVQILAIVKQVSLSMGVSEFISETKLVLIGTPFSSGKYDEGRIVKCFVTFLF